MFKTLINIFRIPELRNKVLFTLFMLAIYRIGYHVPLPGVDQDKFAAYREKTQGDESAAGRLAQYVALFSGGDLSSSTIFGLGIMPYISASIIFQLLTTVVPSLEKLQKEGETGRRKIQEWTRYATIPLCLIQAVIWLSYIQSDAARLIFHLCLPTQLTNRAQKLAADVRLTGLSVAHHAFTRAHYRDAHARQHPRQILHLLIHPPAGPAGPIQHVDDTFAVARVSQLDADLPLLRAVFDEIEFVDKAFFFQHMGNALAYFAVPNQHHAPAHPVGIPDSCQHVRDGILIVHRCLRPQ